MYNMSLKERAEMLESCVHDLTSVVARLGAAVAGTYYEQVKNAILLSNTIEESRDSLSSLAAQMKEDHMKGDVDG